MKVERVEAKPLADQYRDELIVRAERAMQSMLDELKAKKVQS